VERAAGRPVRPETRDRRRRVGSGFGAGVTEIGESTHTAPPAAAMDAIKARRIRLLVTG